MVFLPNLGATRFSQWVAKRATDPVADLASSVRVAAELQSGGGAEAAAIDQLVGCDSTNTPVGFEGRARHNLQRRCSSACSTRAGGDLGSADHRA